MSTPNPFAILQNIPTELTESIQQWHLETTQKDTPVTIVACGMLKAGKSTLMNMLTGHYAPDHEQFKSAVIRETVRVSTFEYDGMCYTDTPGIDANADDDHAAWNGILQADILLFVHSWKSELESLETEFLQKIADGLPKETLRERLILVQTGKESLANCAESMQAQIAKQCYTVLGFEPTYISVSNTRFRKGMLESKNALIAQSGLPQLMDHIQDIRNRSISKIWATRQKRLQIKKDALLADLDQALKERKGRIEEIRSPYKHKLARFLKEMNEIQSSYQMQLKQYENL